NGSVASRHLPAVPTRRSSDLEGERAERLPAGGFRGGVRGSQRFQARRTLGGERQPQGHARPRGWRLGAPPESAQRGQGSGEVLRSEEHTSELQSREKLVCRLL